MDGTSVDELAAAKAKGMALIRQKALVNGAWVSGEGVIEVEDPATEQVIGTVPKLSVAQAEAR